MQIQQDRDFGRNYFLCNVIAVTAIIVALGVSCWVLTWSRVLGLACFVLTGFGFGGYVAIERRLIRRYHCKKCGLALKQEEDPEDRQVFYDGFECDIRWQVGLHIPD